MTVEGIRNLSRDFPRVSIGMPVFNGEKYLRESIEAILHQTYPDFELIISDNASTDHTQEICQKYAAQDSRISYYLNKENLGGPKNYNRVFDLSSGEYFKWAAYDDVIAPDYLRRCVGVLDTDTSIIGCHCKTGRIDQNGNFLGYYNDGLLKKIDSPKPHERFRDLIGLRYTTTPFHGLYRASLFSQSQRHGSYIGADRNLVAELGLMGRIYEIPECLFFWREHPSSYTSIFYGKKRIHTLKQLQAEAVWWSHEMGTFFPHWKNFVEYFRSVNRVPLSWFERLLCYVQIMRWFIEEGRGFLVKDIILFLLEHSTFANKFMSTNLMQNIRLKLRRILLF